MMIRKLMAAVFLLLPVVCNAQDKLIRFTDESASWRKDNPQMALNDSEKARLLMAQSAAFGVECVPSFSPEWTLTYDSVAHALVYREAQKSIWYTTYKAMHEQKQIGEKLYQSVLRKEPKDYVAPEVKTFAMAVSDNQAAMLRAIWTTAVYGAEDREVNILDGVKWEYFISGRRAKSHRSQNVLVEFTERLREAVRNGDVSRKDSLIGFEFQRVIDGLSITPPPDAHQPSPDAIVVITNGRQLPDSLCQLIHRRPKQYFYQQGELVRTQISWSQYGAKKELGIDSPVLELETVPDTLSDAYVSQHSTMQQTMRHVSGTVLGENGQPLADVWVGIYGEGAGAPTDTAGHFSFWLPRRDVKLYAECPGYQRLLNVDVTDFPLRITLKPAVKLKGV